jgi:hypothetical protein
MLVSTRTIFSLKGLNFHFKEDSHWLSEGCHWFLEGRHWL